MNRTAIAAVSAGGTRVGHDGATHAAAHAAAHDPVDTATAAHVERGSVQTGRGQIQRGTHETVMAQDLV